MPVTLNYTAIIAATIAQMIIGALWYSPLMFGNIWMKLAGVKKEDISKSDSNKAMLGMFVVAFIQVYVMAHFVFYTDAKDYVGGLQAGFWLWLGFVATTSMNEVLFAKKPIMLWKINNGFSLLALLVSGVILAVWR